MTTITDRWSQADGKAVVICDFSPPRGSDPALLEPAGNLDVDFVSVAYNPGKSTRLNSTLAAHWIKTHTDRDAVFTLSPRDMNKLAIQSLLLGADLLGVENVVVVKGDDFTERDLSRLKDVSDYRPTELVRSINDMNEGIDFRGSKLRSPTNFCVGASIDLGRDQQSELRLTRRKVEAGAKFFLSQPTYDPEIPKSFLSAYRERFGEDLTAPVFHGVQVMTADSIIFGDVPQWVTDDLEKGRSGQDIALQNLQEFTDAGLFSIYLIPPIMRGGRRDYDAAQEVLQRFR